MNPTPSRVALVGHCVPDAYMLESAVRRVLPGASFSRVNDAGQLTEVLGKADILLVNRVLDGRFDSRSGIELIRGLSPSSGPSLLLISDLAEAQREALEAGALPGFGKRELYSATTAERLLRAAAVAHPATAGEDDA